eukprot:jgi/Ulvmu1/1635/UM114_0001.1
MHSTQRIMFCRTRGAAARPSGFKPGAGAPTIAPFFHRLWPERVMAMLACDHTASQPSGGRGWQRSAPLWRRRFSTMSLCVLCVLGTQPGICMPADDQGAGAGGGRGALHELHVGALAVLGNGPHAEGQEEAQSMHSLQSMHSTARAGDDTAAALRRDALDDIGAYDYDMWPLDYSDIDVFTMHDSPASPHDGNGEFAVDSGPGRMLQGRFRDLPRCPYCEFRGGRYQCKSWRGVHTCPFRTRRFAVATDADDGSTDTSPDYFFVGEEKIFVNLPVNANADPEYSDLTADLCSEIVPQPPVPLDYDNPNYEEGMGLFGDHWDETYGAIGFFGRLGQTVEVPDSDILDADGNFVGVWHYNEEGVGEHAHLQLPPADEPYDYDMVHMYRYHHEEFDKYYLEDRGFQHRRGCRHGWTRRYSTPLPPRDTSPDYHNPYYETGGGMTTGTARAMLHYDENGGTHEHNHADHGYDFDYDMIHMYRYHHDVFDHYYFEDRKFKHRGGPHHPE